MEEKTQYTIPEIMQICINDLKSIGQIPVDYIMSIGLPVARVIHNLEVCLQSQQTPEPVSVEPVVDTQVEGITEEPFTSEQTES